ncbi:MAG TPA: hypothetical protein VFD33_03050 [Bacillota bacterium]|nr:hypothetical protein [Bacillota bacterium]
MSNKIRGKIDNKSKADISEEIEEILSVLRRIRIGVTDSEFEIQDLIDDLMTKHEISYEKEYRLAARNRIDFFTDSGIGIEVKRGKPNKRQVLKQLERYTSFDEMRAIILVVDRNVNIPDQIKGKRCVLFGLNRLWGVALS